jgi:hypothetical protein
LPWARFDDDLLTNDKYVGVSAEAKLLWHTSIIYCAKNLTDGLVRSPVVLALGRMAGIADVPTIKAELVEARLWEDAEGGITVHDYLEYNPTREQVLKDRRANAEDQALWRERHQRSKSGTFAPLDKAPSKALTSDGVSPYPVPVPVPDPVPGSRIPDPEIETAGADAPGADAPLKRGKQPVGIVKKKRAAPANALHFEAICEASHLELSNLTDAMRGPANKATADTFNHGYTLEDIRVCALELEKRDILVTPPSIAKWISRYNARSSGNGRAPPAEPTAEEIAEERRRVADDEDWRRLERQQRVELGLPGNPAEWTAYHEAKRRGEAWHRA